MPAASIMVVRHLVMLAAFLMQPNLPAGTLWPENWCAVALRGVGTRAGGARPYSGSTEIGAQKGLRLEFTGHVANHEAPSADLAEKNEPPGTLSAKAEPNAKEKRNEVRLLLTNAAIEKRTWPTPTRL